MKQKEGQQKKIKIKNKMKEQKSDLKYRASIMTDTDGEFC